METGHFDNHWLLIIGLALLLAVVVLVILPNSLPTPRGALNRQRRELRFRLAEHRQAARVAARALRQAKKLSNVRDRTAPAAFDEAQALARDKQTLLEHAADRVMVAENHVRRVILEQFPPRDHEKLLARYVSAAGDKSLPFRF